MGQDLEARVVLQSGMHFVGTTGSGHAVATDYPAPGTAGAAAKPLELLLLALASCSGGAVIGLLARMEQPVEGLEVRASGVRRAEHPTVLTTIGLEFVVRGAAVDADAVARAVGLAEEKFCPIWAMLKLGTPIVSAYRVVSG